jgi:cell filamentation protein
LVKNHGNRWSQFAATITISRYFSAGDKKLKKDGRYDVTGLPEAQFEPDSNEEVLKNKLGIKSRQDMDEAEARALERAMDQLVRVYDENHRFTAIDICELHKIWLGEIYEWAGKYRQVNVSKGGFLFAAVGRVPVLMADFEQGALRHCTPCTFKDRAEVVRALAETHTELVLIHPFREGNGRAARVLSTLLALQAGLPLLDFSLIAEEKKKEYFAAVQAGLDKNYKPMEKVFSEIIERTLSIS